MIRVRVDNAAATAALSRLNAGNLRGRLQSAVRAVMREGKAEAKQRIERRYTARSPLSLGKVSMGVAGLTGRLTFSGKRNPLRRFILRPNSRPPHRPPGGLSVSVVRGSGGQLAHAFLSYKGVVFERLGKSRLPVKHLNTLSVPGMAKAVSGSVISKMERRLQEELSKAMGAI